MLIARAMDAKEETPEKLAPRIGKSPASVRGYMAGKSSPPMDTMTRICIALGISGDSIMTAAGMPLVPDEAAEIQGIIADLLLIKAKKPNALRSIANISNELAQPLRQED